MTLSPNLSLSVAMVTMSSLADGVCEDPVFAMEWAEDLETGVGPHYQDLFALVLQRTVHDCTV